MGAKNKLTLTVMNVLSWVIFIGLCIKTGTIFYSFVVSLHVNPEAAQNLYLGLNLSALYDFSLLLYCSLMILIILIWGFKAFLFYFAIQIFLKLNLVKPFSTEIASLISKISYVACMVGVLSIVTSSFTVWLFTFRIHFPNDIRDFIGGSEFLFIAGILFIVALIFKSGIEIQSENELTV
jgi:hypothetical protein